MKTIDDFQDMLRTLEEHGVRYLIIGGMAFIYHVKPRYTKNMDLWVAPDPENVQRANRALEEFGSPYLLDPQRPGEILQIGLPPHRIDILQDVGGVEFDAAWAKRVRDYYGSVEANWIDIDSLIGAKQRLEEPRHQEDVRDLKSVRDLRKDK